jgi:hypothetical protein
VHSGVDAEQSAREVNARAYTVGHNIVFGAGQFASGTHEGQRLIAHELTHVVQQSGADGVRSLQSGVKHNLSPITPTSKGQVQRFSITNEPAGGCGICYDVSFPGKGPQNAGRVAHTVVQAAFLTALSGLGTFRLVEFPFSAPGDENGRLDLAVATPTGFAIGEIKAGTPNGEKEGLKDLEWYRTAVAAAHPGSTVERLVTGIPVGGGLPMPDMLATAAGCSGQMLGVVMMQPGLYGYFCQPPFSKARPTCSCRPPIPPPPVREDVKEDKRVKDKDKEKNDDKKPVRPPVNVPVPVPAAARDIAILLTMLAAGALLVAKFGGKRLTGPLTAMAAIVLLANGAEANVGIEGDDALEALFKLSDSKGQSIPNDIKDALRKDPAMRKLLTDAAKSGNYTEAQLQAGEAVTRAVLANRDAFTQEELEILLKATEGNKGSLPQGEVTVEELKKQIARRKQGVGTGESSGTPDGATSSSAGTKEKDPKGDKLDQPGQPVTPTPSAPIKSSAERLVEGMASREASGPKFTAALKEKLLATARAASPPLTDKEVSELLKRLGSAAGKSEDEIVESVRKGVIALRTDSSGNPGVQGASDPKDVKKPSSSDKVEGDAPAPQFAMDMADLAKPPANDEKAIINAYDKFFDKMAGVEKGKAYLVMSGPLYETSKTYSMIYLGRDDRNIPFVGQVSATIGKKSSDSWEVTIGAGSVLYTKGRRYSTTRRSTEQVTPPKALLNKGGEGK